MGCMIWLGMSGSGVGTGVVTTHRLLRLTRAGLVRARSECFAVAVGTAVRNLAEWQSASMAALEVGTTTSSGAVLFCPQVNRELAGGQGVPKLEL